MIKLQQKETYYHKGEIMTTEEIKQGKPISPTAQKVMNIASILGAIATVVFIV